MLPYNDLPALEAAFAERGHEIAAVITEAAAGNMGVVPPAPGFTEGLRRVTKAHGALLVSDEVMTGFRCSASGFYGLEGPYAAGAPDLFTFGKVMGGGFPTAAFGGRADVMALLAPQGPVYQAGTLSGNPVASAAGLATLQGCTPAVYERLDVVSARHRRRRRERALAAASVPHTIQWAGSMFSVFFRDGAVTSYDDAKDQDTDAFRRFFHSMLEPGRAPAAERLRVVVRLGRARRRGGRPRARGAAGRGPRRGRRPTDAHRPSGARPHGIRTQAVRGIVGGRPGWRTLVGDGGAVRVPPRPREVGSCTHAPRRSWAVPA